MANEYEVIKIEELQRMSPLQGLEKYYRHTIQTQGGVILTVDVDEKDWTEEKAPAILLKKAQNADKILKSGGGTRPK